MKINESHTIPSHRTLVPEVFFRRRDETREKETARENLWHYATIAVNQHHEID